MGGVEHSFSRPRVMISCQEQLQVALTKPSRWQKKTRQKTGTKTLFLVLFHLNLALFLALFNA